MEYTHKWCVVQWDWDHLHIGANAPAGCKRGVFRALSLNFVRHRSARPLLMLHVIEGYGVGGSDTQKIQFNPMHSRISILLDINSKPQMC